jgi:hypothetical protein
LGGYSSGIARPGLAVLRQLEAQTEVYRGEPHDGEGNFFVKWMMAITHLRNQNELRPSSL